ncbi:MAG TPA: hypothetical protein VGX26_02555 [Solirubrobacteraceae bacterium]|nr:hypothetical protein [Solirubrobacteraceae bacterium]
MSRSRGVPSARVRYLPTVILALAPILVVLALRLPLINQLNYADAWFYTSYAFVPKHDFAIFGWNYFSVRFPPILAIGAFERAFGSVDGYIVLRYLLAVACGASVYVCVRRFATVRVALTSALLLYLDPFFSRMLLWDYSGFMEVAGGVIGVGLWFWSDRRKLILTVLPGVALAVAVFANALVGTALFVLLAVEAVAALREGRSALLRYGARLLILAGSAALVFFVGYLSYLKILGSLSPYDLIRPTIEFFGDNSQKSAPYQHPVSSWLFHEPRIWAPVVTSFALVFMLRGRLLGGDVAVRIAQFCVAYTAFLWLYRFAVTSSVIETWWAYSVIVVATAPAVGVLLHELTRERLTAARRLVFVCGAYALAAVLLRDVTGPAGDFYGGLGEHTWLVALLIAIGLLAAAVGAFRPTRQTAAFVLVAIVLAVMSYAPSVLDGRGTTGIFVTSGSQERSAYKGAEHFVKLVQNYDSPAHRVFLWYSGNLGYVSMAWADLPQEADTLNEPGVSEALTQLTPLARARLAQPQVKYVMILSPHLSELSGARAVLANDGFGGNLVRSGELVGRSLSYALVVVAKK